MRSSNGTDSARFRKLSRPYANSGQTPLLLDEFRFLLSSLPARTFLSSTPSSSRLSALARPDSLRGFASCSHRPTTRPRGLSHTPPPPPVLMCLLHGAIGIVVTLIQLALIKPLEQVFANAGDIIVGNFTQNIENEITTAIGIDSAAYATALNKSLDDTTATVNNDLFGFAKTAADAVNITTVQFYTRFKNGVHSTFDGTAFAAPVIEFLPCVVGGKVFGLESGLTWLKQISTCACRTSRPTS